MYLECHISDIKMSLYNWFSAYLVLKCVSIFVSGTVEKCFSISRPLYPSKMRKYTGRVKFQLFEDLGHSTDPTGYTRIRK